MIGIEPSSIIIIGIEFMEWRFCKSAKNDLGGLYAGMMMIGFI